LNGKTQFPKLNTESRRMLKRSFYACVPVTLTVLVGCSGLGGGQGSAPPSGLPNVTSNRSAESQTAPLTQLVDLNYNGGAITVFSIQNGKAKATKTFKPANGLAQGLAVDKQGLIYTTITEDAKPCAPACVEVFNDEGKLQARLRAPILSGAPGAPSLTDVSVDRNDNVYVSDYGQQAVYFWPDGGKSGSAPTIVVQDSQNAASVLATPNGTNVLVSGGCGFASVRPYTRTASGKYEQGACFGIGTIALIGGAADNDVDVITPVDGLPGLVSVSSPSGGGGFHTPDRQHAEISGIALNGDASVAYVADAYKERVYAFARPANGWLSSSQPKVIAKYKGFSNLDIIAVRP
jgi:hypothetical protein